MLYWVILIIFLIIVAAIFAVFIYANLPLQWTLHGELPTVRYLSEANLTRIDSEKLPIDGPTVQARQLFQESPILVMAVRRPGCLLCRRTMSELNNTAKELAGYGIRLIGVVHEVIGTDEFRRFLDGELYYDSQKIFFGPKHRWMPRWWGFLRIATFTKVYAAHSAGFKGNMQGDGRLLGGFYLIDKDKILYAHLENGWGDTFDPKELIEAAKKINPANWEKKY